MHPSLSDILAITAMGHKFCRSRRIHRNVLCSILGGYRWQVPGGNKPIDDPIVITRCIVGLRYDCEVSRHEWLLAEPLSFCDCEPRSVLHCYDLRKLRYLLS